MLYHSFKILHILTATLFLTSIIYSCYRWFQTKNSIQLQLETWTRIIPFALFQLVSGFSMISLKQYALSECWILGSLICFLVMIGSWFGFLYFLRIQTFFLILCGSALISMIFLMTSTIH